MQQRRLSPSCDNQKRLQILPNVSQGRRWSGGDCPQLRINVQFHFRPLRSVKVFLSSLGNSLRMSWQRGVHFPLPSCSPEAAEKKEEYFCSYSLESGNAGVWTGIGLQHLGFVSTTLCYFSGANPSTSGWDSWIAYLKKGIMSLSSGCFTSLPAPRGLQAKLREPYYFLING